MEQKQLFRVQEAATYLGISLSWLYKLTHKKEIPFHKPSGKIIYFYQSELDNWIATNK